MSKTLREKLADLRDLECLLMTEHRDLQQFNLETFGERDFNPEEDTTYSRAATALGQMLDMVEDLLELADEDFAAADITETPYSTAKTYTVNLMQIIDNHIEEED